MRPTLSLCRSGLAAAAAVVLLTACGGSEDDTTAAEATSSAAGTSSSPSPSPSPSSTSGSAAPQAGSPFCTEAAGVQERIVSSFSGATQESDLGQLFTEVAGEVRAIEPPPEIAADWAAFGDGIQQIADISQIDFTDPAAVAQWQQQVTGIQSELGAASTNVQSYLATQCGLTADQESASESAAPTS